ncbi:MAG: hypothetical protein N2035_04575 [Chthoniobacterales bacterium]|nr:hypothetical protein [Chthoniobacterales bacterium]MCX7712924.1 hypothetical protein [Chthoniobacterales bacterium]
MPETFEAILEQGSQKQQRRRLIISILIIVVALHLAAGIFAGALVVARYFFSPPAQFEARKEIRIPAKVRDHKMNMAEFDAMTPKPSFTDKLQSLRPTNFALPELPKVPLDQMLPLDPAEIVSDAATSLLGTAGVGGGGSGVGGLGGSGEGFSFMGIQSTGKRILLLFDISKSVVNKAEKSGMPMSRIKEETLELLNKLPLTARFGIVQFSQNYLPFRNELVPVNDQNREAVRQWITERWTEAGTLSGKDVISNPKGFVGILEFTAPLQPDVVYVISDGSFQWRITGNLENIPWKEISTAIDAVQKANPQTRVPFNFITFEAKPEDLKELRPIAAKSGGRIREITRENNESGR